MATSASASASSSTPSPLSTSAFPLLPPEDRHDHPPPPSLDSTDPRVHLDQQSSKWRYEDDQGQEWEWQELPPHHRPSHLVPKDHHQSEPLATQTTPPGHWVKLIDENLFQAQQAAYSVQGVDQEEPAEPILRRNKNKKRKANNQEPGAGLANTNPESASVPPSKKPRPITSLYVTGLPLDCTASEIASVFSRYGLLLEDDEGRPRIKLYHDQATGAFKGEALVVYFKPESVQLAINLLDDTPLRAMLGQTSGPVMKVQRAEFGGKNDPSQNQSTAPQANLAPKPSDGDQGLVPVQRQASVEHQPSSTVTTTPSQGLGGGGGGGGSGGSRRNLSEQEKKRIQKRVARMENKLTDWDSSDEETRPTMAGSSLPSTERDAIANASSAPRTVVLKKMFTLAELDEDPTLLLDLKEDVREECESLGKVTNVVLWDKEPEGIITVKFSDPQVAQICVKKMDGRFFAGRSIDAFLMEGRPRFRRSEKGGGGEDQDEEEKRRVDAFGDWLENGGD